MLTQRPYAGMLIIIVNNFTSVKKKINVYWRDAGQRGKTCSNKTSCKAAQAAKHWLMVQEKIPVARVEVRLPQDNDGVIRENKIFAYTKWEVNLHSLGICPIQVTLWWCFCCGGGGWWSVSLYCRPRLLWRSHRGSRRWKWGFNHQHHYKLFHHQN